MKSLMEQLLGDSWEYLPRALQLHHLPGPTLDVGLIDIEYPGFMQPVVFVLSFVGALVRRRGREVPIQVQKAGFGSSQYWRRSFHFADGQVLRFDSVWESGPEGHLIEFVNPWLGLQMQPKLVGFQLHYTGVRFVLRVWGRTLGLPEWLLGHTTIVEEAVDDSHFTMDFRMTHPMLGRVFRYSGLFKANVGASHPRLNTRPRKAVR